MPEKNSTMILPTANGKQALTRTPSNLSNQLKSPAVPLQKKPKFIEMNGNDEAKSELTELPKPPGHFIDSIFRGQREKQEREEEKEKSRKRERPAEEKEANGDRSTRVKTIRSPEPNLETPSLDISESDGVVPQILTYFLFFH
jgi:hypothetical protein